MSRRLVVIVVALAAFVVAPASAFASPGTTYTVTPLPQRDVFIDEGSAGSSCSRVTATQEDSGWWGSWKVRQQVMWCYNGSTVTSYTIENTWAEVSGSCASSNIAGWATGGGVGQTSVDIRAQAEFTCVAGYTNSTQWFVLRYTGAGTAFFVGGS